MKDVLFQLVTSYELMNPIRGIVPGSLSMNITGINAEDDIDVKIAAEDSQWTKTAIAYVKERITPDSQYKLKKFIDDETLNHIRMDKTLFHVPKSHGSYFDARTGRRTIKGAIAKERVMSSNEKANGNDASSVHQDASYVVQCMIQKTKDQK